MIFASVKAFRKHSQSFPKHQIVKKFTGTLKECEEKKLLWEGGNRQTPPENLIPPPTTTRLRRCDVCKTLVNIDSNSSVHGKCNQVWGRRGWRTLGEYDG
jgi:hypothetical protein